MTDINESPIRAESAPIQYHELPDLTGVTDEQVLTALIKALLDRGHTIKVWGGERKPDYAGTDKNAILDAILAVEEAEITAFHPTSYDNNTFWALLIPSNGAECICDYNDTQFARDVVNEALISAARAVSP